MFWSIEVKILIIGIYFSGQSFSKTLKTLKDRHPGWAKYPGIMTICDLIKKFKETGNIGRRKYVRQPTVLTEEKITDVMAEVLLNPQQSSKTLAAKAGNLHIWTHG